MEAQRDVLKKQAVLDIWLVFFIMGAIYASLGFSTAIEVSVVPCDEGALVTELSRKKSAGVCLLHVFAYFV